MNKSAKTTIVLSSFLILVLLTASIYVLMPDTVKLVVEKTRTKYYVYEDSSWVLGGTEYVYLWAGSTKMRAKSRNLTTNTIENITTINRESKYKENITVFQTYVFNSSRSDVESVPIEHKVDCFNCEGKIISFEYRDILYTGITRQANSPEYFGRNMVVEWINKPYYTKLFQQKYASDKLIIKYRPQSDYEVYYVRMFDPVFASIKVERLQDCHINTTITKEDVYGIVQYNYTCKDKFNYTLNPVVGMCWKHWEYLENGTSGDNLIFKHKCDEWNVSSKTCWWNTTEVVGETEVVNKKQVCVPNKKVRFSFTDKSYICNPSWGECKINKIDKSICCKVDSDRNMQVDRSAGESEVCVGRDMVENRTKLYSYLKKSIGRVCQRE